MEHLKNDLIILARSRCLRIKEFIDSVALLKYRGTICNVEKSKCNVIWYILSTPYRSLLLVEGELIIMDCVWLYLGTAIYIWASAIYGKMFPEG